jgi:hypothetical protein
LADELLDGRFETQPLYLFVEPERLKALGATIGRSLESVFASSLAWRTGESLFGPQLQAAERWERGGKSGPPPYLATLVALTSAAAAMVADQNFSATNYRDRLCGLLGAKGDRAEKVKRDLPGAVRLWQSFNDWLDDWEGALGLPTAKVLGRLVNVGYPISQAIVREADRRAMREAFASYGLTPRRRVGTAEMVVYLADWIGRGHAPGNLTRLWGDASVRERIAQVACDELEHGPTDRPARAGNSGGGGPPSRLEWLAELSLEPMPRLELYLTSRAERSEVEGRWQVGPRTDAGGTAAVEACRDALDLRWLPQVGAVSLEPWDKIGAGSLFSGVLELVRDDRPGTHLLRSPSAVVTLAYDERDSRYHEVSRLQLLDRCLVLAHEGQAEAVSRHLAIHARPGFQTFRPDTLPQLPQGWVAFTDVTLVQGADDARHPRLAALCATPATVIGISGGLRIGQNTWHVSQPPEALAVVDPETAPFRLLLQDRRANTRRALGSFVGRGALDLGSIGLAAGDYELQIERTKNGEAVVVRRATFRLRSADHPRPAGVRRDLGLGYDLKGPWSLVGATRAAADPPPDWLRGGVWTGSSTAVPTRPDVPSLKPPSAQIGVPEQVARSSASEVGDRTHSCTIGPHHWLCEAAEPGDDAKTLKWQECQLCHRFEWTRNRGLFRAAPVRKPTRAPRQAPQMPRYARHRGAGNAAYNRLLDALSYMGSGSADAFRGLCADLDPDPWFAWRALRSLAALGHLDVEYDPTSVRPRAWQVTAPCLIGAETGEWVLAGARSESLVSALTEKLREADLTLLRTASEAGPDVVAVRADEARLAALGLGGLVTPVGAGVLLSPALGRRIALALPKLADLAANLPRFQPGGDGLERFNLDTAAWVEAELDRPGAYRLEYWGRTYGFASTADLASQTMRLADPALSKHLAAQAAGVALVGYDAARQALFTPLGAELPTLLERAVVASSGRLPRLRSDLGQLEYDAVPVDVAAAVNFALHAIDRPRGDK